jgi:hypothetical protein
MRGLFAFGSQLASHQSYLETSNKNVMLSLPKHLYHAG